MNEIIKLPKETLLLSFLQDEVRKRKKNIWFRGHGQLKNVLLTTANKETIAILEEVVTLISLDASAIGDDLQVSVTILAPFAGNAITISGFVREATVLDMRLFIYEQDEEQKKTTPVEKTQVIKKKNRQEQIKVNQPITAKKISKNPGIVSWDYVAEMSDELDDEDDFDIDELKRGDILIHPKLGRCRVWAILQSDAVSVVLPNNRTRKLKINMFSIVQQNDKREFLLKFSKND